MKKALLVSLVLIVASLPASVMAQNVGKCGVGSKLFDGQRGIAPQVLAVTTNTTSGQTFAITSGTSGCTQDGVVRTAWKTAAFIDSNMNKLAKDISRGNGESLDSLASVIGVKTSDKEAFKVALKDNFSNIFTGQDVNSDSVYANIKNVLASNSKLANYSVNL